MGVSKLTGMNSDAINTAQQSDITKTAPQAGVECSYVLCSI
ncbi:hypothetical protein J595_03117 [Acinetobacter sp. 1592897]|nr:hypothetical protein J595_03117 [Acinetobacter sp. 1592897]PRV98832.1 hypothetical protein CSB87_3354 [Acinetobacter sp. AR_0276]